MTALKLMSDAPKDGTKVRAFHHRETANDQEWITVWWSPHAWQGRGAWVSNDTSRVAGDEYYEGYLPLPASAESRDVASTAGDWGEVCDEPDREDLGRRMLNTLSSERKAAAIRELLAEEAVLREYALLCAYEALGKEAAKVAGLIAKEDAADG